MKYFLTRLFLLVAPFAPLSATGQTIDVQLPDLFVTDQDAVLLPITVSDVTNRGLNSFEFTVTYDSTVIAIDSVLTSGMMADGYLIIPNNPRGDRIVVAAAGTSALAGAGTLLSLRARFLKEGVSNLHFDEIKFEPGQPPLNARDGRLRNISLASNEDRALPASFIEISPNFPNPFSHTTRLTLDLSEPAQVRVELFDLAGRLVHAHPEQSFTAGPSQLTIASGDLPAGTYLYRISSSARRNTYETTGTLTIIR